MKNFKLLAIFTFLLISNLSFAQEEQKKIKAEFSGFVRYEAIYDSRKMEEALDGLFCLYPKNEDPADNGEDKNDESRINALAIATRLRAKISGPDAFGAKTSAYVEGDFTGNHVRFRHAWVKLDWGSLEVLAGQYWHPMFVAESFPTMVSLNTGVPFQPFNRCPQLRVSYKMGDLKFIGVAATQNGNNEAFQQSLMPNLHLQMQYKLGKNIMGLGVDYKKLRLFNANDDKYANNPNNTYEIEEEMGSLSFIGYAGMQVDKFKFKVQGVLGQNLNDLLMVGGYATEQIYSIDDESNDKYTIKAQPFQHLYTWANFVYDDGKIQAGIFAGYLENLGFSDEYSVGDDEAYMFHPTGGRGLDIEKMIRISPHVSIRSGNLKISAELEYNFVDYGTRKTKSDIEGEYQTSYELENIETIESQRILFAVEYFF